ncbi:DMT family transporter [Lysobacter pythonis]|uniref:DMT family transporter n=1 Tax=Solilutibacter pythonis TaxID=2483112 RepID=A0A3M2HCY0_9GAMM|nr:DMT family transporter [Lysobacter pythonis]RMH87606.1 DMT family transporter [Lysobacter pythonis]
MSPPPAADAAARRLAFAQLLVGAAIIGTNGLMVRFADTPPTVSAFWRMFLSGILLALLVHFRHGWQPLSRKAWLWIALPSVAFAADLWMWHRSILIVGPGLSTLLANAQVFFMALAGVMFFGERLTPRFVFGVGLAFFGLWLLLGGDWATLPEEYRWGVWLGLATGIAYAAYNIGIKRSQAEAALGAKRAPVEQVLCLASFGSAFFLGLMGVAEGASFAIPSWRSFAILLTLAGIGHCLSWILISRSIAVLSVGMVGLLLLFQPMVAYLLDVILLDHPTNPRQWAGLGVTLAGIFVAGLKTRLQPAKGWKPGATQANDD